MEQQAAELLAALKKPSTNVDARLQLFTSLKSSIKHSRVPESCQATILDCIRLAITASSSAALVGAGLSTLAHYIKRLQLQNETHILVANSSSLCTILNDKLGDARESHRSGALQLLAELHSLFPSEIEGLMHNAIKGHNARAKETAMLWIVKVGHVSAHATRTRG